MIMTVRSGGKKMSNEVWEMINPDYINPMYSPSPSDRSVSPGRFSTASSNAYAPSPWTTVLPFNSPEVPHSPSVRCVASMVKPGGQIYSISITADGLLYTGSNSPLPRPRWLARSVRGLLRWIYSLLGGRSILRPNISLLRFPSRPPSLSDLFGDCSRYAVEWLG